MDGNDSIMLKIQPSFEVASIYYHWFVAKPKEDKEEGTRLVSADILSL